MTDAAVIAGWYTDVVYLKKAGIARISIEIPLDLWEQHQTVLGIPPAFDGDKKFCAITRIEESAFKKWAGLVPRENGPGSAAPSEPAASGVRHAEAEGQDRPRTFTRSQIAALKIKDPAFQAWVHSNYIAPRPLGGVVAYFDDDPETWTNHTIKFLLGIKSKTELDTDPSKAEAFEKLLASYDFKDRVRA